LVVNKSPGFIRAWFDRLTMSVFLYRSPWFH